MKFNSTIFIFLVLFGACSDAQEFNFRSIGSCERCEEALEFNKAQLSEIDTMPGFYEEGQKIKISGKVYKPDGKTPASNVILYLYHTDREGLYTSNEKDQSVHGYNRGWVQTDKGGNYSFFTIKPAPYPNRTEASHIHYTVVEPDGKYYWLPSTVFEGDSLLTPGDINPKSPRGGFSGLVQLRQEGDILIGKRDIILGSNIPAYN